MLSHKFPSKEEGQHFLVETGLGQDWIQESGPHEALKSNVS